MKKTAQVFLSYAKEDRERVEDLYQRLSDAGFKPWMDKDILPGQRWQSHIRQAIRRSDFFLACLSAKSINKRGWVQKEIRQALDIWKEKLENDIYLIPVRLEECEVPDRLRDFQWVDLFEEDGWLWLVRAIEVGMGYRAEAPAYEEPPPATKMATSKEGLESGAHASEIIAAKSSKPTTKLPPHIEMTLRYGSTDMGLAAIGDLGDLVRYDKTRASIAREKLEQLRDDHDNSQLSTKAAEVLEALGREQLIARLEREYHELNEIIEQKAWSKALSLAEGILANKPNFKDISSLKLLIEAEVALEQDNYQEAIRLTDGIKTTAGRLTEWKESIRQNAEAKHKAKAEAERKAKQEAERLATEKARLLTFGSEKVVDCLKDLHVSNPKIEAMVVVSVEDHLIEVDDDNDNYRSKLAELPSAMAEFMITILSVDLVDHSLMASVSPPDVEGDTLALSAARLTLLGELVTAQLKRGVAEEVCIQGENGWIFLRWVNEEVVLIVLTSRELLFGMTWMDITRCVQELSKLV